MGQDSALPLQGLGVQPLVGKLRDYLPRGEKRKKREGKSCFYRDTKGTQFKKVCSSCPGGVAKKKKKSMQLKLTRTQQAANIHTPFFKDFQAHKVFKGQPDRILIRNFTIF